MCEMVADELMIFIMAFLLGGLGVRGVLLDLFASTKLGQIRLWLPIAGLIFIIALVSFLGYFFSPKIALEIGALYATILVGVVIVALLVTEGYEGYCEKNTKKLKVLEEMVKKEGTNDQNN